MSLFLKIMIIVGFGIFTIESNGAEGDSDNLLRLRIRDESRGNTFPIVVSKQKLAFHLVNELDDAFRIYNISAPIFGSVNDELLFTMETEKGFVVFSNIRCNLSLRSDIRTIFLNNCESSEVILGNRRIALHFSRVKVGHSGRKIEVN